MAAVIATVTVTTTQTNIMDIDIIVKRVITDFTNSTAQTTLLSGCRRHKRHLCDEQSPDSVATWNSVDQRWIVQRWCLVHQFLHRSLLSLCDPDNEIVWATLLLIKHPLTRLPQLWTNITYFTGSAVKSFHYNTIRNVWARFHKTWTPKKRLTSVITPTDFEILLFCC